MSILNDRPYLELCQELSQIGIKPKFDVGETVARGFADLGFEEFCILPGPRLLSLLAGTLTPLPTEEKERFFLVPTAEQLINLIDVAGGDIQTLNFLDRRSWILLFSIDGAEDEVEDTDLKAALLKGLIKVLKSR